MTSFFHDLEDQLRAAAQERTSGEPAPGDPTGRPPRRRGRWSWLAGGLRAVPVIAAVAVTLAVVAGALVLLSHRGGQSPSAPAAPPDGTALSRLIANTPPAQLRREFALIEAATKTVTATTACHVTMPHGPTVIHGAPGRALLSTLGLLRRPATAADRLPARALGQEGVAPYAGAARRALTVRHTAYYIVPIRETTAGEAPPQRCFSLQVQALQRALPTIPAALRSPTREIQAASIAYIRTLLTGPPQDAICQVTVSGTSSSSDCGEQLQAIQHGGVPGDDNGTYSGVVPDGVASVTLRFPPSTHRAASSVTGTVHNNVYVVRAAAAVPGKLPAVPTVIWHAADGQVLKTIRQPAAESIQRFCHDHPESCAAMVLAESASSSSSTGSGSTKGTLQRTGR